MFLLQLTSVRLPIAVTATTDITRTLARLTAITALNTSMAAFLSGWVRGSTVSTAATSLAIVISAATMTADSATSVAIVTFVVGVISMAAASAAGVSSTVAADPVVVASTAALRAAADIADRASTLRLCTNGWRLRQPFFFADLRFTEKRFNTKCAESKSGSISARMLLLSKKEEVSMSRGLLQSLIARRSFLARLGLGAGVLGASAAGASTAIAEVSADAPWKPARHSQDDWFDQIPGQHRFVFDTTTPDGLSIGFQFAANYFTANHETYGLEDHDLAVVMIVRHKSTTFGYADAMWAKYGKQFSEQSGFVDPKTKELPSANLYKDRLDELTKKGVHFAVCQMSSRRIAGMIARDTGRDADGILKELAANLVPNARIVPAGIVAVNRAQERGYSFVYAM